jgi:cell division protein FtsQ
MSAESRVSSVEKRRERRDGHGGHDGVDTRLGLALLAAAILVVGGSPFWGPLLMRRMAFFHVRRIEILGARYVAPSDILAKLHVDTMASVWDATAPLARRVASHPGIRSVVVRRKLPGTLVVDVTERIPIALVPTPMGLRVYDERGAQLPMDPATVRIDAPVLAQRDTALLRLLASVRAGMPSLYERVSALRRVGKDELLLELETQPVRAMMDVSLARLAEIDPVESDLAHRQLHATEIDLRFRDQVIARLQ